MFTEENLDPVEFQSSWKKTRSLQDASYQTEVLKTHEVASQSIKRKEKEIQTDDFIEEVIELNDDGSPELIAFLREVVPTVMKILEQNNRSHAYDEYESLSRESADSVTEVHTLNHAENNQLLQITGLSWNATGSVIAASYGRHDHEDWCYHKSTLCTWNLERRQLDADKADTVLELSSCLTCIAFHPKKPAWIVGGTFNGELILWDLGRDDEMQLASSGIGDDSHREPVSKVTWVLDPDSKGKKYHITSVSTDGKILVWHVSERKQKLKLVDGFILLTESLPRALRVKAKRTDQEMGVTCISFSPQDENTFLIGSESGGVFKCNRNARGTPARREIISSVDLRSPVTFSYSPHHGPVYGVELSPFQRNLFLSCGTDTTARIHTMLLPQPLSTVEPGLGYIYSSKWSPTRPLVYACVTESGHLLIYDLKGSRTLPRHKLDASPNKQPVYSLQFNHSNVSLLATGDGQGYIKVWRLSEELTNQAQRELETLEEMDRVTANSNTQQTQT